MKTVKIDAVINLNNDHCKYGEDLKDFLEKVKFVQNGESLDEKIQRANSVKVHLALDNLDVQLEFDTKNSKSESHYTITVDGDYESSAKGNAIWMHTLVYELIEVVKINNSTNQNFQN